MEYIMDVIFFIMGAFFGSFFTLAVYRIPLKKDITHEHSYCPNCNHKLAILDLIPIFSYIFLGGKCRYCKQKIRIRYFLLEILSGIVFMLYAKSFSINWNYIFTEKTVLLMLGLLYFCALFIIAGIDKEKKQIEKSVLGYGLIIDMIYIIYVCVFEQKNIYGYVIYLILMTLFVLIDTFIIKRKLEANYTIQILELLVIMVIFSGEIISYYTILFALIWIAITCLINCIKRKKNKVVQKQEKIKLPIGYYLCVINIIFLIINNFLIY